MLVVMTISNCIEINQPYQLRTFCYRAISKALHVPGFTSLSRSDCTSALRMMITLYSAMFDLLSWCPLKKPSTRDFLGIVSKRGVQLYKVR